jgi:hypothetical protein
MTIKPTLFLQFSLLAIIAALFTGISLYAQTTRTETTLTDSTTTVIVQLSASQKTIIYQYALLQHHASTAQAEAYFQQHIATLPNMSTELLNRVAEDIFAHTQLLYTPEKASPVKLWMQTQTFTEWMLYLAVFLVTLALFRIFYIYRHPIRDFLIRQFAPLFRLLFSRFLVTIELLVIGAGCIAGGVYIKDMALRTIVMHTGIFLIWTQCTALFTKEYMAVDYYRYVKSTLKANNISKIFLTIFIPAIITLVAVVYAMYRLPADDWYDWEAVVVGLVAIYTLPFVKKLEYFFSWPLLFLYKKNDIPLHAKPLAHYTVFTFLVCLLAAAFLPVWLKPCTACLYVLVIILLLIISTVYNDRRNKPAFIYLQFITAAYMVFVLWKGRHTGSEVMVWQAIISINLFIVIKYWQIPVIFWNMNWKRNRSWWGILGMGAVLWLLAQGTQFFLHHYLLFTYQ